jgi:hypothetical protein
MIPTVLLAELVNDGNDDATNSSNNGPENGCDTSVHHASIGI